MGKTDKIKIKANKSNTKKRTITFIIVAAVCFFLLLIGGYAYIYSITPPGNDNSLFDTIKFIVKPGDAAFQGKKAMNILCLGIDYNYTNEGIIYTKGARSDTMFVLSVDCDGKILNMLSIPRDTWVNIPGYGYEKINSAYAIGGINLAKTTVADFLGIDIDHHIIIKVKGVKEIVDTIGGVEVDVPKDMDYDDNWGHLHIHLKKGPHVLNGDEIIGLTRFRHDEEGDWGRMRRQQLFINSLIRDLKKPQNIVRIDKLVKVFHDNIETDLTIQQIVDLARLYKDFDRQNMKTGVVKGADAISGAGASIIIPDEAYKEKLVKTLLKGEDPGVGVGCKISIYNGSKQDGLAIKLADYLETKGYDVVKLGDADRYDYDQSQITIYKDPNISNDTMDTKLKFIRDTLGFSDVKNSDSAAVYGEQISIVIGNKWIDWTADHPLPENPKPTYAPPPGIKYVPNPDDGNGQDSSPRYRAPAPAESVAPVEATPTPDIEEKTEVTPDSEYTEPPAEETPKAAPEPEHTRYTVPIPPAPEPEPTQTQTETETTSQNGNDAET